MAKKLKRGSLARYHSTPTRTSAGKGAKPVPIPATIPRPLKLPTRSMPTKRHAHYHAPETAPAPDLTNKTRQSTRRRQYDPQKHCGAQLRNKERGRLCLQNKGTKTPHLGEGRCWLHGGLTPIKHGLSSLVQHGRLKDMLRKMAEIDHDILDLSPEINLLRAMTIDFVNRYDEFTDHLETWYNVLDENRRNQPIPLPPVPRKFPTLEDAGALLEAISRMVERVHKITREGSITLDQFRGLMTQMGMVVAQECSSAVELERIENGWTSLMVNPRSYVKDSGTVATSDHDA